MYRTIILKGCIALCGMSPFSIMNKSLFSVIILLAHFSAQAQRILFEKLEKNQNSQNFIGYGKEFPSWKSLENIYTVDNTDILKLCVVNVKNKESKTLASMPNYCRGAASWTSGNSLFLFGGREYNGRELRNSLWQYLIDKNQWIEVAIKGGPGARSNPVVWEDDVNVWIYGGEGVNPENGEAFYFADFWKFSKKEQVWEEIKTKTEPSARSRGIGWVYDRTLWLYGGYNNGGLCDMWYFNEEGWQEVSEKQKSHQKSYSANKSNTIWPGEKFDAHPWVSPEGLWMWGGNMYNSEKDIFFWLWKPEERRWKAIFSPSGFPDTENYSIVIYDKSSLLFIKNPQKGTTEVLNAAISSSK